MVTYWKARILRLAHDEGGWIQAALMGAGLLGKLFGGGAKASAEGRMKEAEYLQRQDALKNQQYGIGQGAQFDLANTDLARKKFSEDARGGRAKQALIGDILGRLQDAQINVPGIKTAQISGGLRPSAIGESGRAGLAELVKQALAAQMAGDSFEGGKVLAPPSLSAIPKAGKMEKTMGLLGTLGSIAGGIGEAGSLFGGGGGGQAQVPFYQQPPEQTGLSDIYKNIFRG